MIHYAIHYIKMGIEKGSADKAVIEVLKWLGNVRTPFAFLMMVLLSRPLSQSEVRFYSHLNRDCGTSGSHIVP